MTEEKAWLSCKEAAALLNYSQRHILNLIKNGKISASRNDDGKYIIQKSEFFRAYPTAMAQKEHGSEENHSRNNSMKLMEEKIKHLQEMLDDKRKQNELLITQLNNFTEEKSKMLDTITSHTRLIEFKEKYGKANEGLENKKTKWIWPFKKR